MKLGLIFAACMLIAGCGAAASVDSSAVPNSSSDGGTSIGSGDDSATGTSSGDDGSSGSNPDAGTSTGQDSGSSSGDDGGSTVGNDSGSSSGGGDDGGSTTTTDSGSSSGGGDDGGTTTGSDSGSNGGDDGGVTTTDSGSGSSADSGSGGGDDGGSTSSDGGTTTADSGSSTDGGHCSAPKCVLTQGYYKNHTSSWSVLPVTMGTNDYSESQCLTLLNDPSTGDASVILAKQYIAAVENGGLCDPNASATMAQAQAWFTDNQNGSLPYGISLPVSGCASDHISVPCQAYWLGQSLDSYNNGLSGTPACQ